MGMKLRPIAVAATVKARTYPEMMGGVDFLVFNHRGRALAKKFPNKFGQD